MDEMERQVKLNLTAALMMAVGPLCKVVSRYMVGVSTRGCWTEEIVIGNEINHAWNEAYVDGRRIIIDTSSGIAPVS
ncbi:MAG: transglutaminase domain-containing protein [Firmicutes bacterium]|nr:transglutaminase domain-containing protein [Bacillota bacterium]